MANIERGGMEVENLVQDSPRFSYGVMPNKTPCTKKRIRRLAEPHIEGRKVHGRIYYYYRRGTDDPIYLGSADAILRAKKGENSRRK